MRLAVGGGAPLAGAETAWFYPFVQGALDHAAPQPAVAPVQTPQGLADLAAAAPTQQTPEPPPAAPAALKAKGIDDEDSSRFTYSGPAEDGSAEVKRNGGGGGGGGQKPAAAGGGSRRERREAARRQAKEQKTLRRG